MTLIKYTFIRFFYLRRRFFGITPSERMKAVMFIAFLDMIWILNSIIVIDLLYNHIMLENYVILTFIYLISAILTIVGRSRQLSREQSFSKINRWFLSKKTNHNNWRIKSNIYIASTFLVFICSCTLLFYLR